jgi:KDO2-lipid IV(A) lauroyltransferase
MIPSGPIVHVAVRALRFLPAGPVHRLARLIGPMACRLAGPRRQAVLSNLGHLAPGLDAAGRSAAADRTFANLLDAAVDLWRLPTLPRAALKRLLSVTGREHLDDAIAEGRGVIVVTAHLGPYELGGAWLAAEGYPVHAMVEDLNEATNNALSSYRQATGLQLVRRSAGAKALLRLLRDRKLVLLVADRVVGAGEKGMLVPFGSGMRAIPTGPAALAVATGAPIVVGEITHSPANGARYHVHFEPPLRAEAGLTNRVARDRLTRRVGALLAASVARTPEQWYVFQPEWQDGDGTLGTDG